MARDKNTEQKPRKTEIAASYISVGTLIAMLTGVWKVSDIVNQVEERLGKIVDSRIAVLRPTDEEISRICRGLVTEERDRAKEREAELKEAIDFLMRYYRRG